jgi:drug/metabolite transporter (DMT)-like permease
MSLAERFRAPDSYGLLLLMVLCTIVAAAAGSWTVGRVVAVVLLGGTLLFALRTSGVRRATAWLGLVLAVLAVAVGAGVVTVGNDDAQRAVVGILAAALVLAALLAVVRRLASHPVVSGGTILGALCAYLLIGLLFAAIFAVVDGLGTLFSRPVATSADYLYFSYVTLTTVGYGDLTATGALARMLAVTEALVGQLYLVSVVALVVGNLGRQRRPPDA